jgi:hypothetical protein
MECKPCEAKPLRFRYSLPVARIQDGMVSTMAFQGVYVAQTHGPASLSQELEDRIGKTAEKVCFI